MNDILKKCGNIRFREIWKYKNREINDLILYKKREYFKLKKKKKINILNKYIMQEN